MDGTENNASNRSFMKNAVSWDVALCGFIINRRFGGTCRLHLQGRRNNTSGEKCQMVTNRLNTVRRHWKHWLWPSRRGDVGCGNVKQWSVGWCPDLKDCTQWADTIVQVLPMVDHVAGTGVMLWRFLEGADETPMACWDKNQHLFSHGITSHKTTFFTATAVKTSNPTQFFYCCGCIHCCRSVFIKLLPSNGPSSDIMLQNLIELKVFFY
jgi:hypothetical protein